MSLRARTRRIIALDFAAQTYSSATACPIPLLRVTVELTQLPRARGRREGAGGFGVVSLASI